MDRKIRNEIIKLLNESNNFEEFKNKINTFDSSIFSEDDLLNLRKNSTSRSEYQKLTYKINKQNKPEIFEINVYDSIELAISSKTFYINLMKYSKIPASSFLSYFKRYIVFLSKKRDCDCCLFDSVLVFLSNACEKYYSKEAMLHFIEEDNFDIFMTQSEILKILNLSSTKSLNIRINKFNEKYKNKKIIPFKFYIDNKIKVLFLKRDIDNLIELA